SNSIFHANNAALSCIDWNGGAGSARGGALYISNSVVNLFRIVLATNAASGGFIARHGPAGLAQGGAIYNRGQFLLRESLLIHNRADGGFSGDGGGEANGG